MGQTVDDGPRWSTLDRDTVVAWLQYQDSLCSWCGLPREVCHDPDVVREWTAEVQTCEVTKLMKQAEKRLRAQEGPNTTVEMEGVHAVARRIVHE